MINERKLKGNWKVLIKFNILELLFLIFQGIIRKAPQHLNGVSWSDHKMRIRGFSLYQAFQEEQGLTHVEDLSIIFVATIVCPLLFDLNLPLKARLKPPKPVYVNCNAWLFLRWANKWLWKYFCLSKLRPSELLLFGVRLYQLILFRQINLISYSWGIMHTKGCMQTINKWQGCMKQKRF